MKGRRRRSMRNCRMRIDDKGKQSGNVAKGCVLFLNLTYVYPFDIQ